MLDAVGLSWSTLVDASPEATFTIPPRRQSNGHVNGQQKANALKAPKLFPVLPEIGSVDADPKVGTLMEFYPYEDERGNVVYYIARYELWEHEVRISKTFRPFCPVSGGFVQRLSPIRLPYRLPALLKAIKQGREVFVVEGEKDVEAMALHGLTATCNDGGAGKWTEKHSEWLRDARMVTIVCDQDEPGNKHALQVFFSIMHEGVCCRIVDPATGKDAADHLAAGYNVQQLLTTEYRVGDLVEDIERRQLRWLWHRRIPLGTVVFMVGDGGLGKSTLTLDMARRVTLGEEWPDGSPSLSGGVVIVNSEDPIAEVVRPRLEVAGADLGRVVIVERGFDETGAPKPFTIPDDLPMLRAAIRRVHARLVIIDPLAAYMSEKTDSFKDTAVRRLLLYLTDLAVAEDCAIIIVQHIAKNPSGVRKAQHLGIGSTGISNAGRAGHLVMENPDDPSGKERLFVMSKSNWEEKPDGLVFKLERSLDDPTVARIEWMGITDRTADEAVSMVATAVEAAGAAGDADSFLHELLEENGPTLVEDVLKLGSKEGISRSALYRSRERMGIIARREKGHGAVWELPITFRRSLDDIDESD